MGLMTQLKFYDGKESIYELSKHDDQFEEHFEDQPISHVFHDPIAIYMEELFTTKFQLFFCCEDQV